MKYPNKFRFKKDEKAWLRRNFKNFTTKELFAHIMANRPEYKRSQFTTFRTALYAAGFKKCKILRWTKKETEFLYANYPTMGNIEIAKRLSTKRRPFTKKNVEKKMVLDKLVRTPEQLKSIINAHKKKGTYSKANFARWENAKIKEGERKVQYRDGIPFVFIKVNGILVRYARHRYSELHGPIPKGYSIFHKDMDPLNVDDDNLVMMRGRRLSPEDQITYHKNCQRYIDSLQEESPKELQELPNHSDNTESKIPIRLDRRTIVYVTPGTNIKALKEKHNRENNLTHDHVRLMNLKMKESITA